MLRLSKKIVYFFYYIFIKRHLVLAVKKLFAFIKTIFPYILVPFEYFLLLLCSPIIKIRVGELESRAIGHFTLPVEIYAAEQELEKLNVNKSTYFDIFFFNENICNTFLRDKWLTVFNIYSRYWLEPFYLTIQWFLPNSTFLVPYRHWRTTELWQQCDLYSALPRTKPHLNFSTLEHHIGRKNLSELGLKAGNYVCFHSRDPNYREGALSPMQFRDSSILCQVAAMEHIVELGYGAVRMGRKVRNKLDTLNPRIIDYPFTSVASDFSDIYIVAHCSYMVCTGSGLEAVALMFRKPLVCVNISQWGRLDLHDPGQYQLFIPKKQVWKATGNPLTLTEIQQHGSHWFVSQAEYDKLGIELVQNSSQEIVDLVLEMEARIRGTWSPSTEGLAAQMAFKQQLIPRNGRTIPMQIGEKYILDNKYLLQ